MGQTNEVAHMWDNVPCVTLNSLSSTSSMSAQASTNSSQGRHVSTIESVYFDDVSDTSSSGSEEDDDGGSTNETATGFLDLCGTIMSPPMTTEVGNSGTSANVEMHRGIIPNRYSAVSNSGTTPMEVEGENSAEQRLSDANQQRGSPVDSNSNGTRTDEVDVMNEAGIEELLDEQGINQLVQSTRTSLNYARETRNLMQGLCDRYKIQSPIAMQTTPSIDNAAVDAELLATLGEGDSRAEQQALAEKDSQKSNDSPSVAAKTDEKKTAANKEASKTTTKKKVKKPEVVKPEERTRINPEKTSADMTQGLWGLLGRFGSIDKQNCVKSTDKPKKTDVIFDTKPEKLTTITETGDKKADELKRSESKNGSNTAHIGKKETEYRKMPEITLKEVGVNAKPNTSTKKDEKVIALIHSIVTNDEEKQKELWPEVLPGSSDPVGGNELPLLLPESTTSTASEKWNETGMLNEGMPKQFRS